jgi:hypothetical protein
MRCIRLSQAEKSDVVEHKLETGHNVDFNSTSILNKTTGYMDRMINEAMLGGSLVTTAWRVLRLRMEGSPPGREGSCEYIE